MKLALQMDYIFFFYGLAFFVMAFACSGLVRPGRPGLPWAYLGVFGVVHGLNEWLDLVAYSLGDSTPFAAFRFGVLALSFLFLAEFGRAGLRAAGVRVPGIWSLAVLAGVAAMGGLHGLEGLNAASRYSIGLVGGLCSAYLMVRAGTAGKGDASVWLALSGVTLGAYSLAAGLVVPEAGFFPATAVNQASFMERTGMPIQLVRGVLAVLTATFIIAHFRHTVVSRARITATLSRTVYSYLPLVVVLAVVIAGWIATEAVGRRDMKDYKRLHLNWARTIASSLGPEHVNALVQRQGGLNPAAYNSLRDHLMQIRRDNPDCVSVILRTLRDGRFVLVADGERDVSPAHRGLGQPLHEATGEERAAYEDGGNKVDEVRHGDHLDQVVFTVPVFSSSGEVAAQMVIGFDAQTANSMVKEDRLSIIVITCVFCMFSITAFIAWYRTRQSLAQAAELEIAAHVSESERKLRAITSALGEGVLQLDENGAIVFVNPEAERLLGWAEHELMGLDAHDELHRFHIDGSPAGREDCPSLKVLRQGITLHADEELFTRKDGTSFPVSYVTAPVMSRGKVVGAVVAFQDITRRKKDEMAVRESERSYRTLSENLPGIVYRMKLGDKNVMQFFNDMVQPMTGYRADELEGGGVCSLEHGIVKEDLPRVLNAVNISMLEGIPFQVEYRFLHKDGGTRYFLERGRTMMGEGGKASHIDGVILDITERKRAEGELYKFKFIVEGSGEEIYLIDSSGRFEYANDAACRALGYSLEKLKGMGLGQVDPAYGGDREFRAHMERLRKKREPAFETEHVTSDGRRVAKEVRAERLVMDGREFICATVRDITERKELERQRADLFGIVTHDIKSPLTVINGYADMIMNEYRDRLPAEVDSACEAIIKSSDRIMGLVEDYLAISRLESGALKMDMDAVDPKETVYEAGMTAKALAAVKGQEVRIEAEDAVPSLMADQGYLLRALINLVHNAVNYSPRGGTITIGISAETISGRTYAAISVSDNGPGIAPEEREKIFEKYYRSPRTKGVKGSGLGLSIVKAVAEAHGGFVRLDSEPGRGSTFSILIPA